MACAHFSPVRLTVCDACERGDRGVLETTKCMHQVDGYSPSSMEHSMHAAYEEDDNVNNVWTLEPVLHALFAAVAGSAGGAGGVWPGGYCARSAKQLAVIVKALTPPECVTPTH
jgi:hypothetical protein